MSPDGLLIVDKPEGWTSHDVVAKVRGLCGTRRVGHAGTLDPMATGVLLLGINRATKLLTFLVGLDKSYAATIRLGQDTVTDDRQGEVVSSADASQLTDVAINEAVATLSGAIDQVPSAVSAIKVNGKRSYARVRAGESVELPSRPVTVHRFEILSRAPGPGETLDLDVVVDVSSGTYVRALARDLGTTLGVGGHLTALRRSRVGPYDQAQARSLEQIQALEDRGVLPMARAAEAALNVRHLDHSQVQALRQGQRIAGHSDPEAAVVAAIGPAGNLVAILDDSGEQARSRVVFPAG